MRKRAERPFAQPPVRGRELR